MTWFKFDDNAVDHPKIAALTDRSFRWWVKGLSYASRFLTNGSLPPIFWRPVPKTVRAELTDLQLWDWHDPNFTIHDYLAHQSSKESVTQKRAITAARVTRYRERQRNALQEKDGNALVTPPESREQIQRTEHREQKKTAAAALIVSPEHYEHRRQFCAFVGSKIEVPNGLHAELRKGHGGADPERELQAWYLELNEQAETEAWRIPQDNAFYHWFKSLYGAKFPAPEIVGGKPKRTEAEQIARLQAIERGAKVSDVR